MKKYFIIQIFGLVLHSLFIWTKHEPRKFAIAVVIMLVLLQEVTLYFASFYDHKIE